MQYTSHTKEAVMKPSFKKVVLGAFLGVAFGWVGVSAGEAPPKSGVSPEQAKRSELMKSKGVDASLTILPVRLAGKPFDRVTELVGLLLEQQGLMNIELGKTAFDPGKGTTPEQMAISLGGFIRENPIATDYALFAEFNGSRQEGLNELRAVVVDKVGEVVWAYSLTPQDEAFKALESREPMTFTLLLIEQLGPNLSLSEETAKAAKPGKMAQLMDERSGLPPENERAPLTEREKIMRNLGKKGTLAVFPVRIGGDAVDVEGANDLAKKIKDAGLCNASAAKQSVVLKASQADPNEMKTLWDLAREFRDYSKKNPLDADYVLYADYVFHPENWEQGFVHFVVCDREGEWVIVDMQNSHKPDYQSVKPTTREACDRLLFKRLEDILRKGK
jgi:hypothetical protein